MAGLQRRMGARENESGEFSDLTVPFLGRAAPRARWSFARCWWRSIAVARCGRLPYSHTYYGVRGTRPIGHESDIEAVGRAHRAWPADERARGVSAVRSCGDDCRAQVYLKWTPSKKLVGPEARGRQQASCLTPAGKCLRRRKTDAGRMRIAEVHSLRPFLFSGDGFG